MCLYKTIAEAIEASTRYTVKFSKKRYKATFIEKEPPAVVFLEGFLGFNTEDHLLHLGGMRLHPSYDFQADNYPDGTMVTFDSVLDVFSIYCKRRRYLSDWLSVLEIESGTYISFDASDDF